MLDIVYFETNVTTKNFLSARKKGEGPSECFFLLVLAVAKIGEGCRVLKKEATRSGVARREREKSPRPHETKKLL